MELLAAAFVYALIGLIGFTRRNRTVKYAEPSLCLTCANAVIAHGTRGEESVACNLGGAMRAVNFTVCECTGYAARGASCKLVTIEGFARESREAYAEVSIF